MASLRWAQGLLGVAVVGSATAMMQTGCAEPEAMFFVERVVFASFEEDAGACYSKCDPGGDTFVGGSVNTLLAGGYPACINVTSSIQSSQLNEANYNTVETSRVNIYAYDLTVNGPNGTLYQGTIGVAAAITAPPSRGRPSEPVSFPINVLPAEALDKLGDVGTTGVDVSASVIVYGRTSGGIEVETPEFTFTLTAYSSNECLCDADTACFAGVDGRLPPCDVDDPQCAL